ncbi:hypothetical protein FHS09_001507 [Microbulbifer rhizosphaerae]|uniref:Uncharacterized protein n=1 Tax=Microbulbifer rhizosphaerae TaxID=1562603 RepID=A0A7W4Z8D4_9GAMM|nr:hypothetical protein [Microbulbifer rhizosphaerae]
MKAVIAVVNKSIDIKAPGQSGSVECNYSDNYYGDQVCVLRRSV